MASERDTAAAIKLATLVAQSVQAYAAEETGQYQEALKLHQAAIADLERFKGTLAFFSSIQRGLTRTVKRKVMLHDDRLQVLRAYIAGGMKDTTYCAPPTAVKPLAELEQIFQQGRPLNLSLVWSNFNPSKARTYLQCIQYERTNPQKIDPNPGTFTSSVKTQLPLETYYIHSEPRVKEAFAGWYVWMLRDATNQHPLYILEGHAPPNKQFGILRFHRVSEYNSSCARIVPGQVKPRRNSDWTTSGKKGRVLRFEMTDLPQAIVQTPDRLERTPWGPRRFVYGGHRFVWKCVRGKDDLRPESLFEYTKMMPKAGSRTGKKDDDALPTPLFWEKQPQGGLWYVQCVGGLDQVFKEFLFASQMAKLAIMMEGMR